MHYYYHHIGDFIKDTSFLTNEELGIYMKLIWLYYDSESPLENNPSTLAIKIGARDKVNQVEGILNLFFKLENNKWHQSRCNRELENYKKLSESGKKGAEKRWANHRESIATPLPPHSHPNATLIATNNQEPITKNHIKDIAPVGVSESIFKDYLEVRKAKKAKWTQTALKGLQREADKAKMSLQDVLQLCCERNWVGFKAEWANSQDSVSKQGDDKSWMFSNQGIEAKAKELGVNDYGIQNHQQLKDKVLHVMAKKALQ
jgi:uncharacterized protein YdaU (DUF1376 family)